jgi:hypothetical protein
MWTIALLIFLIFAVYWGYFTYLETVWNGQTPGKRLVKIRVIKADGRSINFFDAAVRNLIRIIDYLPSAYLVGMISMFIDSKNRRLGDFAAGTIVVHEREQPPTALGYPQRMETVAATDVTYDVRKLGAADLMLIETFLARRLEIDPEARFANAEKLATLVRSKLGISELDTPSDEEFLERVAKSLRDTARFHS